MIDESALQQNRHFHTNLNGKNEDNKANYSRNVTNECAHTNTRTRILERYVGMLSIGRVYICFDLLCISFVLLHMCQSNVRQHQNKRKQKKTRWNCAFFPKWIKGILVPFGKLIYIQFAKYKAPLHFISLEWQKGRDRLLSAVVFQCCAVVYMYVMRIYQNWIELSHFTFVAIAISFHSLIFNRHSKDKNGNALPWLCLDQPRTKTKWNHCETEHWNILQCIYTEFGNGGKRKYSNDSCVKLTYNILRLYTKHEYVHIFHIRWIFVASEISRVHTYHFRCVRADCARQFFFLSFSTASTQNEE